jgi:phosphohistidine phosphatase
MKLFILRHGQAETFAASDAERELTEAGRAEVRQVIRKSADELMGVNKLLVSPLRRAQQTADVVLEELKAVPRETCEWLLPESTPAQVLDTLSGLGDFTYLLVSHQPLVGELVNGLCGRANGYHPMNTGALANVDLDHFALSRGRLVWLR